MIAATVADAARVVDDPQLRHDRFWVELEHAEVGPIRQPGLAIRLSETPATFRRAAPCLGQHNVEVLGGELGLSASELAALADGGVIADRPPPGASFRKNAKKPAPSSAPEQASGANGNTIRGASLRPPRRPAIPGSRSPRG